MRNEKEKWCSESRGVGHGSNVGSSDLKFFVVIVFFFFQAEDGIRDKGM